MPNPNISAVLNPGDKTTMKNNVDANKVFLDVFGVNLTPIQRHALAKMGSDSVAFVQDCLQVGKLHPTAVPGDLVITEFEKDVNLFADLNELELHHNPYIEKIADTKLAVGSEAYKQALRIYAQVKELAKHDSNFELIRQQLAARFAQLAGPKPRTSTQTLMLTPNSTVCVINVVEGSVLKNVGSADIMVCVGALTVCNTGTLVSPGFSVNLPAGSTTFTITNKSATDNASFTIKISS